MKFTFCGEYDINAMRSAGITFIEGEKSVTLEGSKEDYEALAAQIKPYEISEKQKYANAQDKLNFIAKRLGLA